MDNITVGGVTLHSPLLNAAGTMGFGSSYADYIDLHRLGGLVTRTMTVKPRRGAEAPRLWETPSGLLNCVGMQNPGYEKFTQVFYKGLVGYDVPIIASVTGTPEEIRRMADVLAELPAVAGVEVNLHCTYEEYRTLGSKAYLEQCAQRIRAAADGRLPVWAKLSPCAGDIVDAARTAQDAGAQAVVCANTYWAWPCRRTAAHGWAAWWADCPARPYGLCPCSRHGGWPRRSLSTWWAAAVSCAPRT